MKTLARWYVLLLLSTFGGCGRDALFQPVDEAPSESGRSCPGAAPFCVAHCSHDGLYQSSCVDGAWVCPSGTRRVDTCPSIRVDGGGPDGGTPDAGPRDAGFADAGTRDGGTTSACTGLDATRCRRTAGCVADTCMECACTPTFLGCRAASAPPTPCPEVLCVQPICCRANSECGTTALTCVPPHAPPSCGICISGPTCESHTDCPSGEMCRLDGACSCTSEGRCVPGCIDDADCREGEQCTSQRRCIAKTCVSNGECGPSFVCQAGVCLRKTCVSRDEECSPNGDSFCVNGQCASGWGECRPPAA